jgi:REP element-mobilizing transposase RayT
MTYYERNLPHWHPPAKDIFMTWRLHGSLPASIQLPNASGASRTEGERFRALDRVLDRGRSGPLWLKDDRVAGCVMAALQTGRAKHLFHMHAFVVMANHVHCLLEPAAPVSEITKVMKGATARDANKILGLTGQHFWQDESFDHWIRNTSEWTRVREYIEQNPVTAGLVLHAKDWPWSSAARRPE